MFISDVLRDRAQTIAKDAKDSSPEPLMLSVIPHARGGHWHRFWTGPLDGERRLKIKWLPPTIVNAHLVRDELTAAVLGTKSPENAKTDEVCAAQGR